MPLTDTAIRNAKPAARIVKLSDGGGLQLWISPTGAKSWCFAFRFSGAQKKLTIGLYPTVTLQQARRARDEAKALLALGADPSQQKKLDKALKAEAEAITFKAIAAELVEKKRKEGKAAATIGKREWLYGLVSDGFAARPIASIKAREVLAELRRLEAKGFLETARRLRSAIGEAFRYAVATDRADADPTFALRGALMAPKVKHRAAIIEPVAFGGLLRAIDGFTGQPTTKAALQLLALLAVRPGELRFAEWGEFDLAKGEWEIPASRMKMRRQHKVPLPRQAVAVLTELRRISGNSAFVFPGYGKSGHAGKLKPRPISENTLNGALRRMGFTGDEMTAHGFRASFSTMANESGRWSVDAIERALAHEDGDAVRKAYARGAYWAERLELAQWWADQCDFMRQGAKVIPFSNTHTPEISTG